jgi:hypothetical protein
VQLYKPMWPKPPGRLVWHPLEPKGGGCSVRFTYQYPELSGLEAEMLDARPEALG